MREGGRDEPIPSICGGDVVCLGHSKRAPRQPAPGTLLGKALASFDGEAGKIEVLLSTR